MLQSENLSENQGDKMMRLSLWRYFILIYCAIVVSGLMLVACGASPNLEKTAPTPSFDEEFSSATVDGEEFALSSGQAIVMYSDHLPQAGGSGDAAVSNAELENQLIVWLFHLLSKEYQLSGDLLTTVHIQCLSMLTT